KVIHHEKATLEQIVAQALRLRVGERPVRNLYGINPRVVEDLVAVEIDDLLDGAHLDAGQALQCEQELTIGLGIIAGPTCPSVAITGPIAVAEATAGAPTGGIAQSRPVELRFLTARVAGLGVL